MIVALCAMLVVATLTICFVPKKYSSSMEVYIVNTNTSYDYTTSSLLSANTYLINDYIAIIQGDMMLDQVRQSLKDEASTYVDKETGKPLLNEDQVKALSKLTNGQIRSMIRSSASDESSIFGLSISHTDPMQAYVIAYTIAKIAPAAVTDIAKSEINERVALAEDIYNAMDYFNDQKHNGNSGTSEADILQYLNDYQIGLERQDCIEIIIDPKPATSHDSPNVPTYTLLAGIASAIIAYVIFLLLSLSKSVIVTEEDVKKLLDHPLIGTVPHWSTRGTKN